MTHFMFGILHEIAEVAGERAAVAVAKARGGRRTYIPLPHSLGPEHWLVKACGQESAYLISQRLGGGDVQIPMGPTSQRARNWHLIRNGLERGLSSSDIALEVGVDISTVKRHRRLYNA